MLADFEEWSWNQRCSQVKPELEPEVLLNTWNQLTLVWTPIQIGTHLEVQMFVFWFTGMRNLYGWAIDYTTSKVKGDHPFNYWILMKTILKTLQSKGRGNNILLQNVIHVLS